VRLDPHGEFLQRSGSYKNKASLEILCECARRLSAMAKRRITRSFSCLLLVVASSQKQDSETIA
jgi:hypothetical protein